MEELPCSKFHFGREFSMTFLRQCMTEDMQVRNLALNTQTFYLQQVSLFASHFARSPEQLGPEQIRDYQGYLTNEKNWRQAPSSSRWRHCGSSIKFPFTGIGVSGMSSPRRKSRRHCLSC